VEHIKRDWRQARLGPVESAMLTYATKLTLEPGAMVEADIEALRAVGLTDAQIHELAQVTALFNYFNRLADGLGIGIDDEADG